MRTVTKVSADVDSLRFGYWDMDAEEFVPIDALQADELRLAMATLDCSEQLLDALAMFAANISQVVGDDLRSIWSRLNELA